MKIFLVSFLFTCLLSTSIFAQQNTQVDNTNNIHNTVAFQLTDEGPSDEISKEEVPIELALLFSTFLPGCGLFLSENYVYGALFFIPTVTAYSIVISELVQGDSYA